MAEAVASNTNQTFDSVAAQTNPTFESAIAPIGMEENNMNVFCYKINVLQNASANKDIRNACSEALSMLDENKTEALMREDVYKVVQAVIANKEEISKLDGEDRRLVKSLECVFISNGLNLDEGKREQFKILNCEGDLEMQFNSNINERAAKELFTRDELDGMSDDYINGLETEQVDGVLKYAVTSKSPDYYPLIKLARNTETRERMYLAYTTRCPENLSLLQEATRLRLAKARLLGKNTHAEYVLEDQMAKTPKAVLEMLNDLRGKIRQAWVERLKELSEMKKKDMEATGKQYNGLFDWDISYYENIRTKLKYNIDPEVVKQYFSVDRVVPAILNIYQKMLGLRIVKVDKQSAWHPDVELYEVWEANEDKFIGHFYLDLYPREGKYSHAAMFPTRPGFTKADGSREYPIASMLTNFPKPTPSSPALFEHEDVEDFMHEMGHVFHWLCAVTKWSIFHGTNVESDFIEAPSQMLENWCWQPSVLRQISSHHKTGKPLPDSLIEGMIRNKNENALQRYLIVIFFSLYDMAIHNTTSNVDVNETYNQMYNETLCTNCGGASIWTVATFGHMMRGYDGSYYSYLWSQVYSTDMFETRFLKEGIDNAQTGMDYRKEILQPGGSRDSMVSLERFLGRKPNSDAFFKQCGINNSLN
ncbi:metalloendopeptidase [Coemansia spiralis]|uniref:Metalloendopeptidase n=2 Tax=Coemansia TaxID=4863 RepID=A0A9W8G5S4_9FUNG|nr:metalloendopeptidase [Coemansia spiralis]